MPAPVVKVELGANLGTRDLNAFTLNSLTKGVLNNTTFTLGGDRFYDITSRVLSVSTQRGKSDALNRIDAGNCSVVLDNSDREFDPLYSAGFYFGQLIPGKEVRISCNGLPVIHAYLDDLDISYQSTNRSEVTLNAVDGLSTLTENNLPEVFPDAELSGARVTRILDLPSVAWPLELRNIDAGNTQLADFDIAEGTQAISYLQLIATTEAGEVFVSKDNKFTFRERNSVQTNIDIAFTDEASIVDFTVIPFGELEVVYGSEQLYNRIILTDADPVSPNEVIAEDADSQLLYGPRSLSLSGLLTDSTLDLQFLADFLLARFKEPQYRFSSVSFALDTLSQPQQDKVLELEIGDIVKIKFTPSKIPPAIEQFCKVIGIQHDWSGNEKRITLSIERLDFSLFILNNAIFGVLNDDRLSY